MRNRSILVNIRALCYKLGIIEHTLGVFCLYAEGKVTQFVLVNNCLTDIFKRRNSCHDKSVFVKCFIKTHRSFAVLGVHRKLVRKTDFAFGCITT